MEEGNTEGRMETDLRGLKRTCRARREKEPRLGGAPGRAQALRKAARELLATAARGARQDAGEAFRKALAGLDAPDEQKGLWAADAAAFFVRHMESLEGMELLPAPEKTVSVSGVDVRVAPDLALRGMKKGEPYYEAAMYVQSAPAVAVKDAGSDLGLYALLRYAEGLVPQDTRAIAAGAYRYERKPGEKPPASGEALMEYGRGPSAVRALSEEYTGGAGHGSALDACFGKLFAEFREGKPREECPPEECAACALDAACHYRPPEPPQEPLPAQKRPAVPSEEQAEAIALDRGASRIAAGAGTGKTFTIAARTVALMDGGARPEEICLFTFSNSAAEEMRERIALREMQDGRGRDISGLTVSTFHAFGQRALTEHWRELGYSRPPRPIDDVEKGMIVERMLLESGDPALRAGLDFRRMAGGGRGRGAAEAAGEAFSLMKEGVLDPGAIMEASGGAITDAAAAEALLRMFPEYETGLRARGLAEFADQELLLPKVLELDPGWLARMGLKHVMVDEAQDCSEAEMWLLGEIARTPGLVSLMAVGDGRQAIYGFRGTSPSHLARFFEETGTGAGTDLALTANRRSAPRIISLANGTDGLNRLRSGPPLRAARPDMGPCVSAEGFGSREEERQAAATAIAREAGGGARPEDIAFIAATGAELLDMRERLLDLGVPCSLMNPERISGDPLVKAALAWASIAGGQGGAREGLIYACALSRGAAAWKSRAELEEWGRNAAAEARWAASLPEGEKLARILGAFARLDDGGPAYAEFLKKARGIGSAEGLLAYCRALPGYGHRLSVRRAGRGGGVALITAHSSKGLEWPSCHVSLAKFDTRELLEARDPGEAVEERRRLAYVAFTRARDRLSITAPYAAYGPKGKRHLNRYLLEALTLLYGPHDWEAAAAAAEECAPPAPRKARNRVTALEGRRPAPAA